MPGTGPGIDAIRVWLIGAVSWGHCDLLLPACGEMVGMRGQSRESELVEAPPHMDEF
jgi:hypothetical protein